MSALSWSLANIAANINGITFSIFSISSGLFTFFHRRKLARGLKILHRLLIYKSIMILNGFEALCLTSDRLEELLEGYFENT